MRIKLEYTLVGNCQKWIKPDDMKKAVLVEIISILFIVLFTYAAISKLLDYPHFRIEMGKSPILAGISGWLAWILPMTEMIIAITLCSPKIQWLGLYLSLTLMTMFTTYLITILRFSAYIPCTCGGLFEKMTWNTHIGFNLIFIALALFAIIILPEQETLSKKDIRLPINLIKMILLQQKQGNPKT